MKTWSMKITAVSRERKRLTTVFSFYSDAKRHSQTLTQSDLFFINPQIFIYLHLLKEEHL